MRVRMCSYFTGGYDVKAYLFPRTETRTSQLRAFKSIIPLTTRVLQLRLMFLSCKRLQAAGTSRECIIELWGGSGPSLDQKEWKFYLEFAASCVSDEDKLGGLVETKNLDELVSVPIESGESSVIERLLVASESM